MARTRVCCSTLSLRRTEDDLHVRLSASIQATRFGLQVSFQSLQSSLGETLLPLSCQDSGRAMTKYDEYCSFLRVTTCTYCQYSVVYLQFNTISFFFLVYPFIVRMYSSSSGQSYYRFSQEIPGCLSCFNFHVFLLPLRTLFVLL